MVCRYYLIFIILWCVGIILYLLSYGVQVLSYIYYLVVCRYYLTFIILWCAGIILHLLSYGVQVLSYGV